MKKKVSFLPRQSVRTNFKRAKTGLMEANYFEGKLRCSFICALIFSFLIVCSYQGYSQITANWFDINPNNSDRDSDSPNGASGGRINRMGATSDMNRVFATSEWGGLYQSFNQGLTWTRVQTFSPSAAWDVKVIPNSRTMFVTSFFDGRTVNPRSGISISNDLGNTWTNIPWPTATILNCRTNGAQTSPSAWQIAINPVDDGPVQIYIGTNCGLAVSTDGGLNWQFIDPSPADGAEQIYAVAASGNQNIDVIGDNGHLRSTDNGVSWSPVNSAATIGPNSGNSTSSSTLAISPMENYVLYAATQAGNIWESDDGGVTWPTSLNLPLRSGGATNRQGRIPFVKTNQRSSSTQFDIWYGDIDLFKTTATTPSTLAPGGAPRAPINNWTNVQNGGHNDAGDVLFDARFTAGACPTCFANDGGVYRNLRSTNPNCQNPHWDQPAITPHGTWLFGMDGAQMAQGVHGIYYGLQDNGLWGANNATEATGALPSWTNPECCDAVDIAAQTNLFLYTLGSFGSGRAFRVYKREDDFSDKEEIPNYPSNGTINFGPRRPWTGDDRIIRFGNNSFALAMSDGVFTTTNINADPISWTGLGLPSAPNTNIGGIKSANVGGASTIYAYAGAGDPENTGQIFRFAVTSAAGGSWNQLPLPANVGSVSTYDVDPTNGNRIIISGINNPPNNQFGMWMTPDFGATWNPLGSLDNLMTGGGVFANPTPRGPDELTLGFKTTWQPSMVKFNPLDPSTIIAGAADAGVFLSLDNGTNWRTISTPLNPTSTNPHIPRPLYAYFSPGRFSASTSSFDVWVGTRGAGVQKVVISNVPSG